MGMTRWRPLLWFIALWIAGVASVTAIGLVIRAFLT
jgi:hypothetical protein